MYKKTSNSFFKHIDFMLLDALCLESAFILSGLLRYGWSFLQNQASYVIFGVLFMTHVCLVAFIESYKNILKRGLMKEAVAVVRHTLLIAVFFICYLFFSRTGHTFSRFVMICFVLLSILLLYVERIVWKRFLWWRKHNDDNRNVLFLAAGQQNVRDAVRKLQENSYDFRIAGILLLDEAVSLTSVEGIPVVADAETALEYLETHVADECVFSIPPGHSIPVRLIEGCQSMGMVVHVEILCQDEELSGFQLVERLSGMTVMSSYVKLVTPGQLFLKRLLDIIGGLAGLLITGVLTVFIAPAIYLADPGPVFFAQDRVGKNGRIFRIYKFRSMYQDAEERKKELMEKNEMKGHMFKIDADPRVIGSGRDGTRHGIGHFIRTTSLDEFPQFWNVLKGDMSLVGTRPPTVDEWREYDLHHHARMAIKPGITGLWQVSGRSDITDFEEVVKLDTEYIRDWSFLLDIKILFRTVPVLLERKGSK